METLDIIHTLDFIGTVLIAATALLAHKKVTMEKKIDKKVLRQFRKEQSIGFIAILLLTISFILKIQL